jgi:ribosome maturation factor RimP
MFIRVVFGVIAAAALTASVSAQEKPVRVRGTIEQVDGAMMTVKARGGETLKIKMSDDIRVVALVKASLADIGSGSYVGSTAMPQEDGRWTAVEVHIFPESMRGTGEGDRPYDYKPKSTMTNGTVNAVAKSKVNGAVEKAEGTTLTLNYKDGEKKIDVVPETVIVTYVPGSKDELKSGAKIYIPAATKQEDGTLTTVRVNVGRGVDPPM